ncbi:MAG: response regulator transcription factor [Oscillospiraceae bacterium]|jgi:two-component system alkaline phosphatase synthesis response regulator PhoP|nr:response regulator transcription factor [Oscillospiraceae bacterium]
MAALIFVTEDDESIRVMLQMALGSFAYVVRAFDNAEDALAASEKTMPSLFIFDIMLPGMDGVSAVKQLRTKDATVPVLMLTAKDTEMDKVVGLDAGADDYLAKPFGVMELAARVRALLRRSAPKVEEAHLHYGDLTIDVASREVHMGGGLLKLTYKEFELLLLLAQNKDRVIPRDELLNRIWGTEFFGETRTLDAHIRSLRRKLSDDADNQTYIKTVRNVGYRFNGGSV